MSSPATGSSGSTGTQSIDRAADLLARIVRAQTPMTFTELADATGLARSTTSRILAALERADLLTRDSAGAWAPGALFEGYAVRRTADDALAEAAQASMHALGDLTGETINLGVARGGTVVQIAQVDSTYYLGSRNWLDIDVPPHASALGKVLYAARSLQLPQGDLERLTPATVATSDALGRQLVGIRDRGYATTVDELEVGLTGVAAPVTRDGVVVAALGLSGPTSRLADSLQATGAVVAAHARALSTRLAHEKAGAA
ncbi:MAG: IclR family transcriptional regulator [Tetrasphaera sp.]|nr:IclR family transcriptional regulator [Tetrasphaera sp.]